MDSLRLYQEALRAGIALVPGCIFGSAPERYRNFIRLNAAHMSDEALPALRTLAGLAGRKFTLPKGPGMRVIGRAICEIPEDTIWKYIGIVTTSQTTHI